jgi:hypothetical protein
VKETSEVLSKIKKRGYWRIVIRPRAFAAERISLADLAGIVPKCAVPLGGWHFPHIDAREAERRGADWVEQVTDWAHHIEFWRLYRSGQFVFFKSFTEDWRELAPLGGQRLDPGKWLSIYSVIFMALKIHEFAANLVRSVPNGDEVLMDGKLCNIKGRSLLVGNLERGEFLSPHSASAVDAVFSKQHERTTLVADSRTAAVEMAKQLFWFFGWSPRDEIIRDIQGELVQ